MSPRNTSTGRVLEAMILPALSRGGYTYQVQHHIGERFGGGKHIVDVVAEKHGSRFLLSLKWQQSFGTAEEKIPFEVISLAKAVLAGDFSKAYLILGGTDKSKDSKQGWK